MNNAPTLADAVAAARGTWNTFRGAGQTLGSYIGGHGGVPDAPAPAPTQNPPLAVAQNPGALPPMTLGGVPISRLQAPLGQNMESIPTRSMFAPIAPMAQVVPREAQQIDHSHRDNPGAISAQEMARRNPGLTPYMMAQERATAVPLVSQKEAATGAYLSLVQQRYNEQMAAQGRGQVLDPESQGNKARDKLIAAYQRLLPQGIGLNMSDEAQDK